MEIRHLKTFVSIVKCGGFTHAADVLGYAQSTVTAHIHELENELKKPLFDRIGKKVILNETGKILFPKAMEIINLEKQARDINNDEELSGDISIGAPETLLTYKLPTLLKKMKLQYPKVNIQIKHLQPHTLKYELKNGNIDLALVLEQENENELSYHKLTK
ncbi:LysR family transcriptional regulator, partial [Staphylococcus ureilyticus]